MGEAARSRLIEHNKRRARPVIRLTDGKLFPSVAAGALAVGALDSSIIQAIKRGGMCRGHRWQYQYPHGEPTNSELRASFPT